jgi:hypothetical protein
VAIVWSVVSSSGTSTELRVARDVAVTPVFPAQFELDLTEPPPAEALNTIMGNSSLKYAYGSIVAYEDVNKNGTLDLVDPNAPNPIDRVLASPPYDSIVYLQGNAPSLGANGVDDNGAKPTAGFSFYEVQPLGEWACSGGPITDGVTPNPPCPGFLWKGIDTSITLTLSNDPTLSQFLCGKDPRGGASTGSPTPSNLSDFGGSLPVRSDPNLACAADGSWFTYTKCTPTSASTICNLQEQCTSLSYALPSTKPADWPCP